MTKCHLSVYGSLYAMVNGHKFTEDDMYVGAYYYDLGVNLMAVHTL